MEMMGVEFERKIREIFAATEVRQREKSLFILSLKKGLCPREGLGILTVMASSVPGFWLF